MMVATKNNTGRDIRRGSSIRGITNHPTRGKAEARGDPMETKIEG